MTERTAIYDRQRSRKSNTTPIMAGHNQETTAVPPPHLHIPAQDPSTSRWSQSVYSVNTSGDHGFSEQSSRTAVAMSDAPQSANLGPLHDYDDGRASDKKIFGIPREACFMLIAVLVAAIICATILGVEFSKQNSSPFGDTDNSSSTDRKSTKSSPAPKSQIPTPLVSNTDDSSSAAIIVTQVATQIIPTTIGTVTVNGSYAGTISVTITRPTSTSTISADGSGVPPIASGPAG